MKCLKALKVFYVLLAVVGAILAIVSYFQHSLYLKSFGLVLLGASLIFNGYATHLEWKGKGPFLYMGIGLIVIVIAIGGFTEAW
ncbi:MULTISPECIES: hypothetical protein [Priestia]|jgi:hypothetical protein|uniref:hypothetical protein n=1 Tax=Priestia TaxID=2800373 RepID=UPI0020796650|nr:MULTISPECIES: hypothetical protein [Priestia]MCU7713161.1 hypothetical protein [Priestia megaterium]MCW1048813.1 hypothetical protein [Priestia sp. JV24]USL44382.1 hypothetical protein LIS78_10125 [Priestia megaterium]